MDYILDIIIPKKEINIVKLKENLVTWGDSVYSREPPQYITDSGIVFEQIEDTQYYSKILGEKLTNDVIVLNLKSHLLFELEYAINNNESALEKNELLSFLNELFELSDFYVLLVREDEKVKERYRITAKEEIGDRLADSLRWSEPKDVLLFKKKETNFIKKTCFIIASVFITVLVMTFGAVISSHNKTASNAEPPQTDHFIEENAEPSAAAAAVEQASVGSSETVEEPVQAETSAPKKVYQYQAREYLKDEVWELKRASIFIHHQSGGQAYLKLNESFDTEPLYQDGEMLGYYYNFTVREVWPDSTEMRNCFYVKEDLSEILCMETATGNLYDLEFWRNSFDYAERMEEISHWQQEREELLFASEGQAPDEPWYDAYRAIVADWTLIEDSDWSSDLYYMDVYFGQDYQFDSYWLYDIDTNGTPELFLYSNTGSMTSMAAVVTYTDRPVVVIVEMVDGINLETAELIEHGHWHGAGGTAENEWTGYRIQGDTAEYSMGIDYYDYIEEDLKNLNHYVIYHPETDEFENTADGREYEEIYAAHVANCIWTRDIPKYDLMDDLSGLRVIYKGE